MRLNISLHETHPILHMIVEGELTREHLTGFFEKLTSHKHWQPGMPILDDISKMELVEFDPSIPRMLADEFNQLEDRFNDCRFAIYTPRSHHFGLVRQFLSYIDVNGTITPQVFKAESDAIQWLLS